MKKKYIQITEKEKKMERNGNTLVASFSVNVGRSTYVSNEQIDSGEVGSIAKRSGYLNASEHPDSQKP